MLKESFLLHKLHKRIRANCTIGKTGVFVLYNYENIIM
jgi:hypothetical protein